MAASFVQISNGGFSTSSASLAVSFSSNVTVGNFVIVAGAFDAAATSVTVTIDGSGGSATDSGVGIINDGSSGLKSFVQAFFVPTGTSKTVTATYSGTNPGFGDLYIWEVSGLSNATFDKVAQASAGAADSGSTGVLSSATEAAVGYGCTSGGFSAPGIGWTTGQGSTVGTNAGDGVSSFTGSIGEHRVLSATTAINGTATGAVGTMWCATFMSGGGGVTNLTAQIWL